MSLRRPPAPCPRTAHPQSPYRLQPLFCVNISHYLKYVRSKFAGLSYERGRATEFSYFGVRPLPGGETPRVADSPAAGAGRFFHNSVPPSKQTRLGKPPNNVQRSPVQSTCPATSRRRPWTAATRSASYTSTKPVDVVYQSVWIASMFQLARPERRKVLGSFAHSILQLSSCP